MNIHARLLRTAAVLLFSLADGIAADPKPAAGAKAQIQSAKDILSLVPKPTLQDLKQKLKADAARLAANEALSREAKDKPASFKIKSVNWDPWDNPGMEEKYRMMISQPLSAGGLNMQVNMWFYFTADQQAALAKTGKGQDLTVSGELYEVRFDNNPPEGLTLHIDVRKAKVEGR
jgi:hypothetical protein